MSTDLELRQELVEIRLPARAEKTSQSSDITDDDGSGIISPEERSSTSDEEECQTPKSPQNMIPKILTCPPAPKKPTRKVASCKRKFCELQFFEVVGREEVESFFKQFDMNSNGAVKRRCLV